MSAQPRAAAPAIARPRIDLWALACYLIVGVVALAPRALDLGRFLTDDEANFWLRRSAVFLNAVRSGDFAATAMTTHPGVTTMWLGAAGIVLRRALTDWGLLRSDAFTVILALMRLPAVLVHVAVILLCYRLLRRMLPGAVALLAALLWAADPFVVGYSRLLHTDALAMSFATLSLLAACYRWNHGGGRRWLAVSGASAGLAFLSKSPSLALLPAVALVALLADDGRWAMGDGRVKRWPAIVSRLSSIVRPLAAWSAIAALTVLALWPALWVGPLSAYREVQTGVVVEGAQPHMLGNFFLGRHDDAPGLLYYPVALALRLTPWTLAGVLLLALAWRRDWPRAQRRDLAALAGFAILFVAAMSLFPKKFDRYVVPAFPSLDILAAAGLVGIVDCRLQIADWVRSKSTIYNLKSAIVAAVGLVSVINLAWWHPYSIVAFNQLFGGTRGGAQTFVVGWGEGLEQVAGWLNRQPDITGVRTISLRVTSLNPYLKQGAQADFPQNGQLRDHTGYVVVYLPETQGELPQPPFDQFYGRRAPLHTVSIHGVDMAWIYQAPPAVAQPRPAGFGPSIRLLGFDQEGAWRRGQTTRLRLTWETSAAPPVDYWLFAHLIGPDGRRYAQIDLPCPTSQWAPGRFAATDLPLAIPQGAPPGAYRLLIGLYTPDQGQRLALAAAPADAAADDANALVLARFDLK